MRGALARSVIQWLVASAAFLGLAVALTWPWVAHIRGRETFGDAAQFVWDSWWLLESVSGFENPWFTDRLFAPEGTWLTAHPLEALLMVVLSPLTAVVGPMTAFGILVIVTLALAGVLAWRLGLCLGLGHVGAAVAGLLWAASPIVVYKSTGHYMLLVLAMLLPAALVLAARLARSHSTRDGAFLGLLLGASMLTDLQVTAYLLLALVASATYVLATRPAWRSRVAIRPLVALAVTFVLVGLPLTISVLRAERDGDYSTPLQLRMFSATHYNADATQFVLPSPASRFFSDDYHTAAARLGNLATFPIDTPVTLGWAALTLAVVGVAATWRRRRTWWMVCAVLACMLLSLGPNLKVAGRMYTPLAVDYGGERVSAIAPASWLLWMPVVKDLRIPARFMQLGVLPLVLMAGIGASVLVRRWPTAGTVAVAGLCGLAIVEGAVAVRGEPPSGAQEIARIIRDDRSDGIVVDVPLSWQSGIELVGAPLAADQAMLQQTIHGKPIASGYIARMDNERVARLIEHPLYRSLLTLQGAGSVAPPMAAPTTAAVVMDARRLQARWIVVWPEADRRVLPLLRSVGYRRAAEANGVLLFRPTGV